MAMYVIADLHLHPQGETLQQAFSAFVAKLKRNDELFILGDLFNFYVGIDKHNRAQLLVKNTLAQALAKGVTSYFIRGNRDFLMTEAEAHYFNMMLLKDVSLIRFGAEHIPVLLSHGDIFCTNDLEYMSYYKKVHNPFLQRLFRMLPMFVRRKIANNIREQSMHTDRSKRGTEVYGVVNSTINLYALEKSKQEPNCSLPLPLLVHGHIHKFEQFGAIENVAKRYVLGAWGANFSYFKLSESKEQIPQIDGSQGLFVDSTPERGAEQLATNLSRADKQDALAEQERPEQRALSAELKQSKPLGSCNDLHGQAKSQGLDLQNDVLSCSLQQQYHDSKQQSHDVCLQSSNLKPPSDQQQANDLQQVSDLQPAKSQQQAKDLGLLSHDLCSKSQALSVSSRLQSAGPIVSFVELPLATLFNSDFEL